jgi:hypothetical protein
MPSSVQQRGIGRNNGKLRNTGFLLSSGEIRQKKKARQRLQHADNRDGDGPLP